MKELGIKAIYCKRNISKPHPKHEKAPYLLKGMQIDKPDMVWTTDITYLKAEGRTYYLCVVLDWTSREVHPISQGKSELSDKRNAIHFLGLMNTSCCRGFHTFAVQYLLIKLKQ